MSNDNKFKGGFFARMSYAWNGGNGNKYDYKTQNGNGLYAGSQIAEGVYVSARDVGNFAVGRASSITGQPKMDFMLNAGGFNLTHSNVYVNQMTDSSFSKTSYDFQVGMVGSLINHIYSAKSNKDGEIDGLINNFNKNNNAGWNIAPNITPGMGWRVDYKDQTVFFPPKKLNEPTD
ncbi:hypothetical protein [Chryseobacterium sp. KMC2]|uniref:hypothetical protein n=1 Tax=Chryseobacterium sp. KMC2 TaxID=2800705 RepID=UPI001924FDAB|nr:hypothetical protein [Chryseobacterium sp. KMC2]MBL3547243.1 hypothetical protein [Chryseobacterium sp. KMC2]